MSWVAGIDYSSNAVDVVLIDEDGVDLPWWLTYPLEGADAFERTREVAQQFETYWVEDTIAIGIEAPAGKHGVHHMARVQGAILSLLPRELLIVPLPPARWRKIVGLSGKASKADVEEWVRTNVAGWKMDWPQDACDAYCIAAATRALIEQEAVTA